jgi:DNA-binding NarL/FixJ family response regulator
MPKPKLLLADDHQIVIEGLRGLLRADFDLVGTAADGMEMVERVQELSPDCVVADVSMPLLNGIDALRKLRAEGIDTPLVFLTMHPDATYLTRALEAGAAGYVVKHAASDELIGAIRAALRGETFVSPQLKQGGVTEFLDETRRHLKTRIELTARQRDVLQLLAEGKSAKEIGALLDISSRTVETHKYKMMDDLGVKTTAQLVQFAIKEGLIA